MDNNERMIKKEIREEIWKGICLGANIQNRENPYAVSELLEQNTFYLNQQTEKVFQTIKPYLKD